MELAVGLGARTLVFGVRGANRTIAAGIIRTFHSLHISAVRRRASLLLTLMIKSASGPLFAQNRRCIAAEVRFGSTRHLSLSVEEILSFLLELVLRHSWPAQDGDRALTVATY